MRGRCAVAHATVIAPLPTAPIDHGWDASQAITSMASSCSCVVCSSHRRPSESPLPLSSSVALGRRRALTGGDRAAEAPRGRV